MGVSEKVVREIRSGARILRGDSLQILITFPDSTVGLMECLNFPKHCIETLDAPQQLALRNK